MKKTAYMVHNPSMPNQGPIIDPDLCIACYTYVNVCRTDVLVPSLDQDRPPIVLYRMNAGFAAAAPATARQKPSKSSTL
jgi:ferredoxin